VPAAVPNGGTARVGASFRDPSGFLFRRDGVLYRQVNRAYRPHYERLMSSGLYGRLADAGLLLRHEEVDVPPADAALADRVLRPAPLSFISYPYEWCFSQLRDAALLTLQLEREARARGMTLKDASAYNVQFAGAQPLFIDTLSFEPVRKGMPWRPYRQFCQHFLAPLALVASADPGLGRLSQLHIDGIPLPLASRLLPWRTRLRFGLLVHLHVHAASQRRLAGGARSRPVSDLAVSGLIDSLERTVRSLAWQPAGTTWHEYTGEESYSPASLAEKKRAVHELLALAAPAALVDLGANDGQFSAIGAALGASVIAIDGDPSAVEKNYLAARARRDPLMLPLLADLANPPGGAGWDSSERQSLLERLPRDTVMALALVHHLAIGNNVPLARIAALLARLGRKAVVEFIPREDPQVQRMLASREDIFAGYTPEAFEHAMQAHFALVRRVPIEGSARTLYLFA